MADGGFEQIRLSTVRGYGETYSNTKVLYSRPMGPSLPSISGWIDQKRLVCFIGETPYILRTDQGIDLRETDSDQGELNHYPEEGSGLLTKGLDEWDSILLPVSNFTPDGLSYIVYSQNRNALVQRSLDGKDITSVALPDSIEYLAYKCEYPKFSSDGLHICFIGLAKKEDGRKLVTLWVADVSAR